MASNDTTASTTTVIDENSVETPVGVQPKSRRSGVGSRYAKSTPSRAFPAKDRAIRLSSLDEVAAEMARIYRASARGELGLRQAGQLAYILGQYRSVLEAATLGRRIEALENAVAGAPGGLLALPTASTEGEGNAE